MAKIAVIGAGTMGHALALVFAIGGHRVRLTDSFAPTLARAPALMEAARKTLNAAGETDLTTEGLAAAVTCHADLAETVADAEWIIEAIIEQPEAKRVLFEALDAVAPMGAVIASNTSYLDPFPLIPARRQGHAMILHWYTPPYLVDLVDVVPGPDCDPALIQQACAMIAAMGKQPVVLRKFLPGYIANRIQSAISAEVFHLLEEDVASPEEIDAAIVHGLALRLPILGHLAKADFTGLELARDALRNQMVPPAPRRDHSTPLDARLAEGRSGVRAGGGWYDWSAHTPEEWFQDRDARLLALKRALREIGTLAGPRTGETT
ncbi:3-hydroxybutyryl-CoA dehydrogenase [Humitalea rosea]|uniref:L-gulonate 3-dehydrogenase n=1 Tax=Humitalea rosea TaxID=990373 RepID=A0A2W7I7K9_9PROT|nr:3-hydroxyacyl-CoA dehydrogenase family protein [Humitalea rosea]PZW42148.1 3-hydroxybutyryl-CoA dehydrogenase [Humitalea rosea]